MKPEEPNLWPDGIHPRFDDHERWADFFAEKDREVRAQFRARRNRPILTFALLILSFVVISFVVKHLVEDVIAPQVAAWECRGVDPRNCG